MAKKNKPGLAAPMPARTRGRRRYAFALLLMLAAPNSVVTAHSQRHPAASPNPEEPQAQSAPDPASDKTVAAPSGKKEQLLADTAKLQQLATELKSEVDKTSKDTLSVSVVKKADEVGKLARKVRDEMKGVPTN